MVSHAAFEALSLNRTRHSCWNFAPAPSILRCPQCWASGVSETRCRRPPCAKASNETKPSFAKAIICFARAGRAKLSELHQSGPAGNSVSMLGQKPRASSLSSSSGRSDILANVTEKPSGVNRQAGERGPQPAPLFVEPLSASVDLPMKRAVPTPRFSIRKPRSPRRGFRLLWTPAIAASAWHADLGALTKPFSLLDENVLKQRARYQ
jgi:hypothetical protein